MASPEVKLFSVKEVPSTELGYVALGNPALHTSELPAALVEDRLQEAAYVDADPTFHVQSSVVEEVRQLTLRGVDVKFTNPFDIHALDPDTQLRVDAHIAALAEHPDGGKLFLQPSAMGKWGPLTKRAIALHTLYNARSLNLLGEGISESIYDKPMFPKGDQLVSAADIIRAEKADRPDKAEQIITSYKDFVNEPIDPVSREFYQGSLDARAVRTRALTAIEEVSEHFADVQPGTKLKSASLACGAAGPVKELIQDMEANLGVEFSEAILVDKDPMALASAAAVTDDIAKKVRIEHRDLLAEKLTDYIEPQSVDVVDLLGLFEYIPEQERIGNWATQLLKNVKEIVKPGGVIVFGNMLNARDQQKFFTDVVKWPRLYQRSVQEVLDIIGKAGFDPDDVNVRIPAKEGVYAVYTISIPKENEETPSGPGTSQFAA